MRRGLKFSGWLALLALLAGCATPPSGVTPYVTTLATADGRNVDVRIMPARDGCRVCDVVIFSHGYNLTYDQYDQLFAAWAHNNWIVIAPLHVDSEAHPRKRDYAPTATLPPRLHDWAAIVRALDKQDPRLVGLKRFSGRYVAAGHSYGALIAQLAGGARADDGEPTLLTELPVRPSGIVALSPPGPVEGHFTASGWQWLQWPQLVVTGTNDVLPVIAPTWEDHLASFHATRNAAGYALIYTGMDHYFNGAFGRLKDARGAASRRAAQHLSDTTTRFMTAALTGRDIDAASWRALSNDQVDARARPAAVR